MTGQRLGCVIAAGVAAMSLLVGCGHGSPQAAGPSSTPASAPSSTAVSSTAAPSTTPPSTTASRPRQSTPPTTTAPSTSQRGGAGAPVAAGGGKVVVLDPGHNGGNGSHLDEINAQVPDGRGGHKACNTTGTSTDAGYTEHAFTFDVATRVRNLLQAKGFHVIMTRNDDSGVGPCVDQRAAIGNRAGAAAVVSIHADGAGSSGHGFHVNYSSPPLNSVQGQPSISLATDLRDVLQGNGFSPANYIGSDGLYGRSDLAGLNLSDRPSALVECGNMRNSADADVLSSDSGKQRIAAAIATAIEKYLS